MTEAQSDATLTIPPEHTGKVKVTRPQTGQENWLDWTQQNWASLKPTVIGPSAA